MTSANDSGAGGRNKLWTTTEVARAEQCVLQGLGAWQCRDQFPGRTINSLLARFNELRTKHGLVAPGVKEPNGNRPGRKPNAATPVRDCLLRRQLETGQHFIRDRAQFAAVCASVGLAA